MLKIKKRFSNRLLSVFLSLALVVSLLPGGFSLVAEAAETGSMYVTLHFNNSSWEWASPAIQYWNGTPELSDAGETVAIPGWGGVEGTLLTAEEDNEGWYKITLKGSIEGFQFLDFESPDATKTGSAYESTMATCTGETPTDLYFNTADSKWYLDSAYETPMPVYYKLKDYFKVTDKEDGIITIKDEMITSSLLAGKQNIVTLTVKDSDGKVIRTIKPVGSEYYWDCTHENGSIVGTGEYIVTATVDEVEKEDKTRIYVIK